MTTANTNHWKLGLFVVVSFVMLLAVFAFVGASSMKREGVRYVSYFDESVQGLEVGAAVKYRGVTVGTVIEIAVAPDRRHVQVVSELGVEVLDSLGLSFSEKDGKRMHVPRELRVQLGSTGLTGLKFVLIDFFDPERYPPPELPFAVPENHIPAAPSLLKNLEDSVTRTAHRLPELADDMGLVLKKVNRMLDTLENQQLSERAVATIENTNMLLTEARAKLRDVDAAGLSKEAHSTLSGLNGTVTRMNKVLDKVEGEKGLLVSMERASTMVGDVARDANGLEAEMEETLRDVQEAAKSIRKLADALERDPDMLLKGKARNK
jgi:ABC-type transporter Mla subunit MlaD